MFREIWQDVRFGWRSLWKRPAFAVAALLTLALGIGANTAVFTRRPPRADGAAAVPRARSRRDDLEQLARIRQDLGVRRRSADYETRIKAFRTPGRGAVLQVNLTGDGDPVRLGAAFVTPNLFAVLGVNPLMGRHFTDAEAAATHFPVVILSYQLWQTRYDGADVLGRTIQVNGVAREIIGVMPKDFQLPTDYVIDAEEPTRLFAPSRLNAQNRGSHGYHGSPASPDGATIDQANAQLAALAKS